MPAGIEVPVSAPGLGATTDGFNKLGNAAEKSAGSMVKTSAGVDRMGKSFESLKAKLGSGEVIRNGAASMALMATAGTGAAEKVAGLAGALASVPGPIGLVAAGVAAAVTIFNVYSKSAEEAAKRTAELKKEIAALGKERTSAQMALAGQIAGAAKTHGTGLRKAMSQGASEADIQTGLSLTGGDAATSLGVAGALGASKLDQAGKDEVVARLKAFRDMGNEVTAKVVTDAIKQREYELQAATGSAEDASRAMDARSEYARRGGGALGSFVMNPQDRGSNFTNAVLDMGGRDSSNNAELLNRYNASQSQGGQHNARLLAAAEAPTIADAGRQFKDAFRGAGAIESEALKVATLAASQSTDKLTEAITELTTKITERTNEAGGTETNASSVDDLFKYGRESQWARR
jgi:hypothetical protein